jgi:hypothetical protein
MGAEDCDRVGTTWLCWVRVPYIGWRQQASRQHATGRLALHSFRCGCFLHYMMGYTLL